MPALARVFQKIFGNRAGASEISQFGSLAQAIPNFTTDPALIQALSNFDDGWFAAVLGGNSPTIEDMNALFYLITRQQAYMFERGVPEWNPDTTYYTGCIVSFPGAGILLRSRTNNNLNNNPASDFINWERVGALGLNPQVSMTLSIRAASTWASHASGDTSTWQSVCWAPELAKFLSVALATTGADQAMHSADGKTWTGVASASNLQWRSVAWSPELNLGVAVAINGTGGTLQSMWTTDGVTWSDAGVTTVSGQWYDVKWIPEWGMFVAVGLGGGTNFVMTSTDGKNWTAQTATAQDWTCLAYSPDLNLAVAVGASGVVMSSSDGATWVDGTPAEANQWHSVCWSDELGIFVAVALNGTNRVMWSRDGDTWVAAAASESSSWRSVAWSPQLGIFVAVASATAATYKVMSSPDGLTWTDRTEASAKSWYSIAWSPELGIFASVANDGGATADMVMISRYVKKFVA